MSLFILGATGGTGSEVVGQALQRGHQVTAFVRSPEKIAHRQDWLRVLPGFTTSGAGSISKSS